MTHTYFQHLQRIATDIVETDHQLQPLSGNRVVYAFNESDHLHEVSLADSNFILVLKTSTPADKHSLDVLKLDVRSGDIITRTYNSKGVIYSDPGLRYNRKNGELLVYSRMRNPAGSGRPNRSVFVSLLDKNLEEAMPFSVLSGQFTYADVNFVLANERFPWLAFQNFWKYAYFLKNGSTIQPRAYVSDANKRGENGTNGWQPYSIPYKSVSEQGSIRLSRLNAQFRVIGDTLIENAHRKNFFDTDNFARFQLKNNSYLLLVHKFGSRNGLMMVAAKESNQFVTTDILIHDKNHYLLPQLRTYSDNSVLVPYLKGRMAGLLKLQIQ